MLVPAPEFWACLSEPSVKSQANVMQAYLTFEKGPLDPSDLDVFIFLLISCAFKSKNITKILCMWLKFCC